MMDQIQKISQTNLSRACVFIDSSNPSMPYQVIDSKIRPLIKIPFPPVIDPVDLIGQQSNTNNIPARAPNAFIIYRKAFIDAAHSDGYHLPMRIMSSMASQSWEQEPDMVKSEYRRLANEAFNLRNEMYPKSGCRRKRAKWNIVSFKNKNKTTKKRQKWNIVSFDPKKSNSSSSQNKTETENEIKESVENEVQLNQLEIIQQIPSPIQSSSPSSTTTQNEDFISDFNNIFSSPEMNFDMMTNDTNLVYQNMIPSPELSITSSLSPELTEQFEYDLDFCYSEQSFGTGIFNQTEDFQQIKNDNHHFDNYYQNQEFDNNNTIFYSDNNNNLFNENISSSQEYFNEHININFQSANIESDAPYLYDNMNYNGLSGLGISNSLGIDYFQNSIM
ncbi:uncharacterized protein OCT59_017312 [Rhizophagus irregularis]|uniref:MATA-HMG n=2 Tax=Rhizophagus irregularis TaxID=588596 RepID=U9UUL3_RHIID|nr:hypothetical protein GLOIN_2v1848090 [Rhizophagus irregularis DAOM 181602=DAOM 197198]EXX59560.1 hypothetical protein RirG_187910 [Rhizophagus irregularis DAOM 197198w]POG59573.1 hypothetical protein GLOIN_2v1848090 [Rhizophagus irregularis DAOM 181602=DAOM 197198]UZO25023.1 hypothetical protein OCT59_017312 [Rhizophagus irregularis]CAG8494622.1 18581_t:CDS:1 [Rhizophagus irregularis]|eukprot:XP_025166439.1 hypothetical protein GLOIN_2v1848090 [Rhizophagus irregularis DAOM 181602=DAOM 197198]